MKNGVLVVMANRQQGIVRKLLIKRPGFLWSVKISADTEAYRLLVYEEVFDDLIANIEAKLNNGKLDWFESRPST